MFYCKKFCLFVFSWLTSVCLEMLSEENSVLVETALWNANTDRGVDSLLLVETVSFPGAYTFCAELSRTEFRLTFVKRLRPDWHKHREELAVHGVCWTAHVLWSKPYRFKKANLFWSPKHYASLRQWVLNSFPRLHTVERWNAAVLMFSSQGIHSIVGCTSGS